MKKRYKTQQGSHDPMLPHGMRLSEHIKLTASRCGNAGYVVPVPPSFKKKMPDGSYKEEQLHDGSRKRMVALDEGSKTQRRKANRTKDGDTSKYGAQARHKMRQDGRHAGGNRRKVNGESKRQALRTCGHPFDHLQGFVDAPGQGCPQEPK